MKLNEVLEQWHKKAEEVMQDYIGVKPSNEIAEELMEELGVHSVVFFDSKVSTFFGNSSDSIDYFDEETEMWKDHVLSGRFNLVDEDSNKIYQSSFNYLIMDVEMIDRAEFLLEKLK